MLPNDILSTLNRLLGPLKVVEQSEPAAFEKFQDLLRNVLTQASLETRKSGVQVPNLQNNSLPEAVSDALEKMRDEIVAAQPGRKPTDPVFWVRERDIAVTGGFEDTAENMMEPSFSFGPFLNQTGSEVWFDFFQFPPLLRFFNLANTDFLVITLPTGDKLPEAGKRTELNLDDCTVWLSVKTIAANADKKYVGIRAKNCTINFPTTADVSATGIVQNFPPTFTLSFRPFDKFGNGIDNNGQPKAAYAEKVSLVFNNLNWSLQSFSESFIQVNGDRIDFKGSAAINPLYLESEALIHFPIPAVKDSWDVSSNETQRFGLGGRASLTNTGWYLPVLSANTAVGIALLGTMTSAGSLGARGLDGLNLQWPGLENGKLAVNKFLLLARPGRIYLKYSFTAGGRLNQQLAIWQTPTGDRSKMNLKPLPAGEGICINDNQQMEWFLQPVAISAKVDRPLNTGEQRFTVGHLAGAVVYIKIANATTVIVIGSRTPVAAGEVVEQRKPQSICLRNALLTVDNPTGFIVKGNLAEETIADGICHLMFPVYRLVNMLPDPYISNQNELFNPNEMGTFNELWRNGKDTLNNQFQFLVAAVVQWKEEKISLQFAINQPAVFPQVGKDALLTKLRESTSPCGPFAAVGFNNEEIERLRAQDFENVSGSHGFLQALPGDRSLLDVSGSANFWGVSFSSRIGDEKKLLSESLGFPSTFPFRIKGMDLVSSGRMSRLFTLPHIQWEPVMRISNPQVLEPDPPVIMNFADNGAPTRIASAQKKDVELLPRSLYDFIVEGFHLEAKPQAAAAHFGLPFGICAFAYFNPIKIDGVPSAKARKNQPSFSDKNTGDISGAMQLRVDALPPPGITATEKDNHQTYFIGSVTQRPAGVGQQFDILGKTVGDQFSQEFSIGATAKVPLTRIDFSGYGASIFSKWVHDSANYGQVSQVRFDVMIGRTAHEVIQIKSVLFPCGAPVVRSIVMERKNTGIVTRFDSGWVATGPGEFNFLSHVNLNPLETNPYSFHPGTVTGFYNITEIKDLPHEMDIPFTNDVNQKLNFAGVYYNSDVEIENISKGAFTSPGGATRVHSAKQLGYVMLANPADLKASTTLATLFPPKLFKKLLLHSNIGGSLGGPLNAVMKIAGGGQLLHATRVDVSPSNEAVPSFVVAVRGTVEFLKEGSWSVVKCLPSKEVVPLANGEAVPLVRNGLLKIDARTNIGTVEFKNSRHSFGDPAEIDKYAPGPLVPALQYSFLQATGTQKLLFRRPSFLVGEPTKIGTETPDLADAFRLLRCKAIFPNLADTLSLPDGVKTLFITSGGNGLKFDESLFGAPVNLNDFTPKQLKADPAAIEYKLLDESGFQVFISYTSKEKQPSKFKVDLNSDAIEEAVGEERKKWQTVNKDLAIKVNLGSIKPLLTLRGGLRAEAGKDPVFEKPECELGEELDAVKKILQILALLSGKAKDMEDTLKVVMGNSSDSWNYKMSIDQRIPVIQFPGTEEITLSTPPPLIIEASLSLGVFFNLSLSPDPKNLIKPGAGATFGFEGMLQIQLITIGVAAAYGVGITKIKAYVDLTEPKPVFDFTFGFGATVIVDLPVVGLVSITRSFSLAGNIDSGRFKAVAGQMLRGVLSLAGGLLIVAIQIEGSTGVENDPANKKVTASFQMIFALDVSLAFVISYDFTKTYTEDIALN
jgi:hypothetical protein